ncbi:MAG: phytanoyl-CoA dioxygenase family protein [Chthoniobacteraceae bacterium]
MSQLAAITFPKSTPLPAILDALDTNGVLIIPDYLDSAKVSALTGEFLRLFETNAAYVKTLDYKAGRAVSVQRPLLDDVLFPHTAGVFSADYMKQCADRYYRGANQLNSFIFCTHDQPREEPINPIHFDKISCLKFFIYLKDTTAENGAFDCSPGSHHISRALAAKHLRRGGRVKEIPNQTMPPEVAPLIPIEGPAGAMIVFTTDAYHRGGVVSPGTERYVMRGHCANEPALVYEPSPGSRQWWRESLFNPMRYLPVG